MKTLRWWKCSKEVIVKADVTNIRIDLPALSDLVAYLRARDDQQAKIDALAARVEQLTTKLSQSSTVLKGSVNPDKV